MCLFSSQTEYKSVFIINYAALCFVFLFLACKKFSTFFAVFPVVFLIPREVSFYLFSVYGHWYPSCKLWFELLLLLPLMLSDRSQIPVSHPKHNSSSSSSDYKKATSIPFNTVPDAHEWEEYLATGRTKGMLDLPCFKLRATQNLPKITLISRMAAETVCLKVHWDKPCYCKLRPSELLELIFARKNLSPYAKCPNTDHLPNGSRSVLLPILGSPGCAPWTMPALQRPRCMGLAFLLS